MKRLGINPDKSNNIMLDSLKDEFLLLDLKEIDHPVVISDKSGLTKDILVLNPQEGLDLFFDIANHTNLHVAMLCKNELKQLKITANVGQNCTFESYFADFIPGKSTADIVVNLNGENARCDWHLASLSKDKDNKEFNVSSFHNNPNTYSQLDNYGVVRDDGKLVFSGICKINNGSHGSKAHQNAKIMVFDSLSNGVAKPILKIDENDIEASHAAVVGKINDEHIFYLTSRGLSEEEAKRIITLGYLKPILNGFIDEDMKSEIEKLIEGNM